MMKSFFFDFGAGEDHHVEHVSVYPETNGTITLAFEDHNGDDEFSWSVDYAVLAPMIPAPPVDTGSVSTR